MSSEWALSTDEEAWAAKVLPSLFKQRDAILVAYREPYCVLVDFDTVPFPRDRLSGAQILGLPILDSPGLSEPTVAIEDRRWRADA